MASRLGRMGRRLGVWIPPALLRGLGRPAAVFFHGVEAVTADPRVQINHHETDAFCEIARVLKADFDVLPLSQVEDALARPERHRRTVFLMSDDGYANTLSVAAPILETLGLPWTLFVSTHHIDTGARNPVFLVQLFFHYMPGGRYRIPHLPLQALGPAETREGLAQSAVHALKKLDMARAREAVEAVEAHMQAAGLASLAERFASETFLDWDAVKTLHAKGVEIGAHADWHWPMDAGQTPAQLREQAVGPKARIEAETGPCRGWAVAKAVAVGNKAAALRLFVEAVLHSAYRPAMAVRIFLQIFLPDRFYRRLADSTLRKRPPLQTSAAALERAC